jgi:mRNA-degrading endonuclease YafQ of YafQ-DinJ toxin-antitoxin module
MIDIEYSSEFVRVYKRLDQALKSEVKLKIEEFRNPKNHKQLRIHSLHGSMRGLYAFSVSYRDRIVFEWGKDKRVAYLLDIGDHDVYE